MRGNRHRLSVEKGHEESGEGRVHDFSRLFMIPEENELKVHIIIFMGKQKIHPRKFHCQESLLWYLTFALESIRKTLKMAEMIYEIYIAEG